jgi:hypothetical protein
MLRGYRQAVCGHFVRPTPPAVAQRAYGRGMPKFKVTYVDNTPDETVDASSIETDEVWARFKGTDGKASHLLRLSEIFRIDKI